MRRPVPTPLFAPKGANKASAPEPDPPPEEGAEAGNVDRIRDILFGRQMTDYERRFEEVEARLAREADALRDEVRRRFESLEELVKQEMEAVSRRLDGERADRESAQAEADGRLKTAREAIEKQVRTLREETDASASAIRQQVRSEAERAQEALTARADALAQQVEAGLRDVRAAKVDRASLAAMLNGLAAELAGEE